MQISPLRQAILILFRFGFDTFRSRSFRSSSQMFAIIPILKCNRLYSLVNFLHTFDIMYFVCNLKGGIFY